ncbi:uncharacterized protein BDZ99DRAFT_475330 [Mytilinidion resinicola]|uniref:Glycoside hydrolase n=1 Tax=Mytilinidion resinicola TaxID=574789 RepID=A0A6A6YSB7_9PEZI|nr:uncharacterized protein BDZ99DRAFT_475330 [Mytilinidion resinicola]KAF2811822.1 hypothetical protein BDZ99DRAFT_475330 [Mytilinidion resinicola]
MDWFMIWLVLIQAGSSKVSVRNPRVRDSSFDPGGSLVEPEAISKTPLLDLRAYPRMDRYLESDVDASFIVDTPFSYVFGKPFSNSTFVPGTNDVIPLTTLKIQIISSNTGDVLVPWTDVGVNTTSNEIQFPLHLLPASHVPYPISVICASADGLQTFQTTTLVRVLPPRNDTGSVVRMDQKHGGLMIRSTRTLNLWKGLFPFSFYTSWDWISSTITNSSSPTNLTDFRSKGFNLIHPVPPGGTDPFNHAIFSRFLDICDELEIYVMYDMRHTYQNRSSLTAQIASLQSHPSLLLYYTADEPDGQTDPLNATSIAYSWLQAADPYHPVSLVLNCANFHFGEYTSGADIILEDTYPIATNNSYSIVYDTVCNTTYGCCGCDNCHAYDDAYPAYVANPFLDIPNRIETYGKYQEWLGLIALAEQGKGRKSIWGVPQAFYDQGSFWKRWPTGKEEAVMAALRLNHGAKGVVAWIYPTDGAVEDAMSGLAKVVTGDLATTFLLYTSPSDVVVDGVDAGLVDVKHWWGGEASGKALVTLVYMGYSDVATSVRLSLQGKSVRAVESVLYGSEEWSVEDGKLVRQGGLEALEVGIFLVEVGDKD